MKIRHKNPSLLVLFALRNFRLIVLGERVSGTDETGRHCKNSTLPVPREHMRTRFDDRYSFLGVFERSYALPCRNVTLLHKIDNNRAHSSSTSAAATTSTIIITIHSHQSLRTDTPKHQQTQLLPAGWSREHNHNVTALAKMAAVNLKALNL